MNKTILPVKEFIEESTKTLWFNHQQILINLSEIKRIEEIARSVGDDPESLGILFYPLFSEAYNLIASSVGVANTLENLVSPEESKDIKDEMDKLQEIYNELRTTQENLGGFSNFVNIGHDPKRDPSLF